MKKLSIIILGLMLFLVVSVVSVQSNTAFASTPSSTTQFNRNLTIGNSGDDVTSLQQILNTNGFLTVTPTGYFGSLTKAALAKWQASVGISPASGYFGSISRAHIATHNNISIVPPSNCPAGALYNSMTGQPCSNISIPPVNTNYDPFPLQITHNLTYVQSPAENQNVLHSGERAVAYGSNLPANATISIGSYTAVGQTNGDRSEVTFTVPSIPPGTYSLYLFVSGSETNKITITVVSTNTGCNNGSFYNAITGGLCQNPSTIQHTLSILSPTGGQTFANTDTIQIGYSAANIVGPIHVYLTDISGANVADTEIRTASSGQGVVSLNLATQKSIASTIPAGLYKITLCDDGANAYVGTGNENCVTTSNSNYLTITSPLPPITPQNNNATSTPLPNPVVTITPTPTNIINYYPFGIDSRIAGKVGTDANTDLFSTEDDANSVYVWNTSNWLYGVDMTMISPWNSDNINNGIAQAGVLITPRHLIQANHFFYPVGTQVRFVKQDGTVVTRTVIGTTQVKDPLYGPSDLEVAVLDSDVPAGIGFAKVLPSNYLNYFPTVSANDPIPVIRILGGGFGSLSSVYPQGHLKKQATVGEYITSDQKAREGTTGILFQKSALAPRAGFYMDDVITGDSGNGGFLLINGQLVIQTVWSYGPAGGGSSIAFYHDDINSAINSLGNNPNNYQVTTIDLSGSTNY